MQTSEYDNNDNINISNNENNDIFDISNNTKQLPLHSIRFNNMLKRFHKRLEIEDKLNTMNKINQNTTPYPDELLSIILKYYEHKSDINKTPKFFE